MLTCYRIEQSRLLECDEASASVWICQQPSEAERAALVQRFGLDEHAAASAVDPDEPSRLELAADHRVVIVKYPKNYSSHDKLVFKVSSMGLFLFDRRLVVLMGQEIPLFSNKIFNSVSTLNEVFLKILYCAIRHFQDHLRVITMMSESLEAKLGQAMENRTLLQFFTLEKSLVFYLNAIQANGFVIERLKHAGARLGFTEPETDLLDDIHIENTQSLRQAEIHSNVLASLMDARASIVGNNLNILMKNLTLITIGIMAPTLVVSIFSMNVPIPGQDHHNSFWLILVLVALTAAAVLGWWRFVRKRI